MGHANEQPLNCVELISAALSLRPFRKVLIMHGDRFSMHAGDAGYPAMLARFTRQPRRNPLPPARTREPLLLEMKPAVREKRESRPTLSSAEKEAVQQLQIVWAVHSTNPIYLAWRDACRVKHLSPLMCIEVTCLGMGAEECDNSHMMSAGTAQENMHRCLAQMPETLLALAL